MRISKKKSAARAILMIIIIIMTNVIFLYCAFFSTGVWIENTFCAAARRERAAARRGRAAARQIFFTCLRNEKINTGDEILSCLGKNSEKLQTLRRLALKLQS